MDDFFDRIDLDAIADPGDKVRECEFFLNLATVEMDRSRFRWLISAYLNAVYSYFETAALYASVSFTNPQTGDPIQDREAVEKLRAYVGITQNEKSPYYVKTHGLHPIISRLYQVRKTTTHLFPLAIMSSGLDLPEDFHLGNIKGEGEPLLELCRQALDVVKKAQTEINA